MNAPLVGHDADLGRSVRQASRRRAPRNDDLNGHIINDTNLHYIPTSETCSRRTRFGDRHNKKSEIIVLISVQDQRA